MLEKLLKMANSLDSRGFTKEADMVDEIMKKVAEMDISSELDDELDSETLPIEENMSFKEIQEDSLGLEDEDSFELDDEEDFELDDDDDIDDNIYVIVQGETEPLNLEYFFSKEDAEAEARSSLGSGNYTVVELRSSSQYEEDEEDSLDLDEL